MSAHCNTCGTDLVYPPGTYPLGECPVCSVAEKLEDERAEIARLTLALTRIWLYPIDTVANSEADLHAVKQIAGNALHMRKTADGDA